MEPQGNLNSREAQEVRQRSEFLKRVTDFAQYMQKEYIEPSDGEMSLLISAGDATTDGDGTLRTQCRMGRNFEIAAGLASMMRDEDNQPLFRLARRMADDYTDLDDRRRDLRRKQRTFYALTALTVFWTGCIVFLQAWGVANCIATITNLLLMAYIGFQLWTLHNALQRDRRRLSADEHDHARNRIDREVAQAMHRFFARFRSEQDGEDE